MLTMRYSDERGTYNLYSEDGEWYYEGTYEECDKMMENSIQCELEEEESRCCAGYEEY